MLHKLLFIAFLIIALSVNAQQKRIKIVHADNSTIDEENYPGATVLLGNVYMEHDGISLRSKKAIHYKNDNFLKAFGDVVLNQGDSISQTSTYVEYNGNNKLARSWGNVILKDALMTLTTDTLDFNRTEQLLYYRYGAIIEDTTNVLESKEGNYFLKTSKFQALSNVVLTNPDYVLESDHLDYFTNNGQTFLYGPSTITGKDNFIYTEKGFYDTKTNISHFTKNARIEYNNRTITADSLYYDRNKGFASATKNIQMKDTVNNSIIRGNYAEFYKKLDSAYVVDRAVAIMKIEKDSMYIHGDTLLITGNPEKRILRAFHRVKFFKKDLSGKCDSIHTDQQSGLTQLFKNPVLWSQDTQITGDSIHLISNPKTEKLDSLKVLQHAFIIQKDSTGFNQIKGRKILGKFIDNDLHDINVIGNSESILFLRNDNDNSLIGIDKTTCSSIFIELKNNEILSTIYYTNPDGETKPPSIYPEDERLFKGFIWRENERPFNKEDIFIKDDDIKEVDVINIKKQEEDELRAKFIKILEEEKKTKEKKEN
ncbi:MAG: OstA-like protein [Aureibaculum sp.]|nr:OstA-like protein [Aureibaculum sp.]